MYRQSIQFPIKDAALRDDVHALGELIGETLRDQGGADLFDLVEGDRLAAIQRREGDGDAAAGAELEQRTAGRSADAATDLTRAFSIWFQAVNTAEKVQRVRRRRQYLSDSSTVQPGGIADCIARLQQGGVTLMQALELIGSMSLEPVFTGHPTESTRRTILRKQQHIAEDLLERHNPASTSAEIHTLWARVRLELTSIWQTEEHPREGLTVVDEREHVLFYLIDILYRVVPLFYEEIEAALAQAYGVPVESLDIPSILHFGSWVGGDMDGNPDVHGKTIRETLLRHQQLIVSTYFSECGQLAETLSQSASRVGLSSALAERIAAYSAILPGAQKLAPARHDRMPYRMFFGQIGERLRATYEGRPNAYQGPEELLSDVGLAADSLLLNRGRHAGYFLIRRFMRRVRTFGFHLATLDVTQHTQVHDQVIAQGLGDPSWPSRSAENRLERLRDLLARDQGPTSTFDAIGRRTLWVFDSIAQARHKFGVRAIGEYVVSGAQGPEDVLAVLLLARWADITDKRTGESPLDVAPLLESIGSLERAGDILRELNLEPAYRRHVSARGNRQVVMIGYSDTNKEGGIAASRFALQVAQTRLLDAARDAGIDVLIFHGRGGTPSRGGGRTENLVEAVPDGAIRGVLRLTEQGEVVNQSYGLRPIAMRTLERSFASVALATAHAGDRRPAAAPQVEAMRTIAAESLAAYRALVYDNVGFFDYMRAVTPLDVIERMHIGSRPAARSLGGGITALRAIPWVFAWTQSRHMLPGWFGFGSGLEAATERHGAEVIGSMAAHWPFFTHLLDDVESMLARTDLGIAGHYDLLAEPELRTHAEIIAREYRSTVAHVLRLRGSARLLDGDPTLQRSIQLRNPYIDPMHLMQVDLLARWRRTGRQDKSLFGALRGTIGGIAQGLQATG
ncbi:MAG TPA: phosphoenolpyruvate carboxylase [Steroidobacteraceae bacterium]|jgi:phosphoenolpyruvate carboxylase|nr:phosphoenolpyruvate carboxylase [Steroidobacteraceae bacterium]